MEMFHDFLINNLISRILINPLGLLYKLILPPHKHTVPWGFIEIKKVIGLQQPHD